MATPIGALRAEMSANAAQWEKDLGRARRAVQSESTKMSRAMASFRASATGAAKSIFNLRTAAVVTASAGGLALLVKKAADVADSIDKTAGKLGVGVEALQEYRYAADLAGIAQNTFDMAIQRLGRRAAEAAEGMGEAKAVLEEMNIPLRDTEGRLRPIEELLLDIAEDFKNTADAGERLRKAFKLFDSEGVAMVNMLKDGKETLMATRQEARDLGLVLEEKLIKSGVRLKDELARLGQIFQVNLTRAMLANSDAIAVWVGEIARAIPELLRLIDYGLKAVGVLERTQLEVIDVRLSEISKQIDKKIDQIKRAERADINFFNIEKAKAEILELAKEEQALFDQRARLMGQQQAAIRATTAARQDELTVTGAVADAAERAADANIREANAHAEVSGAQVKVAEAEAGLADETDRLTLSSMDLGRRLVDSFDAAALRGQKLGDVLADLAQDLASMVAKALILQAIGGVASSIFGGPTTPGGLNIPGTGGDHGTVPGQVMNHLVSLPRFARGGGFRVGGAPGLDANLVSFWATRGEQVSIAPPGSMVRGAGDAMNGGVIVHQTNNFEAGVTKTELQEVLPIVRDQAAAAVFEAVGRSRTAAHHMRVR